LLSGIEVKFDLTAVWSRGYIWYTRTKTNLDQTFGVECRYRLSSISLQCSV